MQGRSTRWSRALTGVAAAVALVAGTATPAEAAVPTVRERSSAVVTADGLPTVQVDGVVWTQVVVGGTVYAAGDFTTARPAGAAPKTSTTARRNLLAYNLSTGKLTTTFKPAALNGQVKALAVSGDRTTIFAGGDFTLVGSSKRLRFAAFDAKTGALRKAAPAFNTRVNALAVVGSNVYVGGWFTRVGTTARSRVAAVNGTTGKLTSWAPKPSGAVNALVATPDQKKVVIGGGFDKIGTTAARGMGAVDVTTGKVKPWRINTVVRDYGSKSAILSLTADADTVYGSGYAYGGGNFEGAFAANPADGSVKWLQDCHGDTYGVAPIGELVYVVGHAHTCQNIGGFPEATKRQWYRALVVSKKAAGTVATNAQPGAHYGNFAGQPAPALSSWFPELTPGTFTGTSQSAWSVVGNATYVAAAGEFTAVNGKPQQGLVRFAVRTAIRTPGQGPLLTDASTAPVLRQQPAGVVVEARTNADRDQRLLSYAVVRRERRADGTDGPGVAVGTPKTAASDFWNRLTLSWTDSTVEPGRVYRYEVAVTDADGHRVTSPTTEISTPTSTTSTPTGDG
ncbi:hypothetical protein SAMN04488543_0968 [Friedmanniella luteola]|uniref:Fibronectin type-III domain-containing protein n=1 Tax=Friedmanniella luteola TaxID=546871 RepID=A0A1H1P0S5_9ACTN|nr:hypothetical protein [Friedmanniella luteola]SDS04635.1 hypothetical protein SAMN04488543_0968 [Friedmanniella luteola]